MNNGGKPLENRKHEAFALLVAEGSEYAPAYRQAVSNRGTAKTSHEEGSKLASAPKVSPRIEWLRRKAQEVAEKKAGDRIEKKAVKLLDQIEKREIAATIARSTEERAQDRIAACKLDNDLAGDGSEAKGNESLGKLAELLGRLRK